MASLAEIRAKLKEQESRTPGGTGGGDNAIFPFWNIPENNIQLIQLDFCVKLPLFLWNFHF